MADTEAGGNFAQHVPFVLHGRVVLLRKASDIKTVSERLRVESRALMSIRPAHWVLQSNGLCPQPATLPQAQPDCIWAPLPSQEKFTARLHQRPPGT